VMNIVSMGMPVYAYVDPHYYGGATGWDWFAWAAAYVALGARPDLASAILYSLNAMTSYGHVDIFLANHWRLMGAIEALNGMMLFGLSTAFLFAVLREHWPAKLRR